KVQIGAIGLSSKQKFLYVYDYGEEWTFIVEVDNIKEDSQQLFNPYVKETKGEAPQQYDGFY
ncbi:MAG TPA: plasmid pRiA4b ORF-3 family protein, partial [Sporosarcina psychrophila]|nr:plasmid pRiA4b ORF-3 family protein [Sporosarcina psychrophila]